MTAATAATSHPAKLRHNSRHRHDTASGIRHNIRRSRSNEERAGRNPLFLFACPEDLAPYSISSAMASIIVEALTCSFRRPSHEDPGSPQNPPKNHFDPSDLSTPSRQQTSPL